MPDPLEDTFAALYDVQAERAADRRALEQAEKALAQTPDYVAGKREALAAVRERLGEGER